jgi:hypothetical protein
MALRGVMLWAFVGRRELAAERTKRAGRYAGNPQRAPHHPTAERLLEALQDIPLTIVEK